jgi:hypothetical protein
MCRYPGKLAFRVESVTMLQGNSSRKRYFRRRAASSGLIRAVRQRTKSVTGIGALGAPPKGSQGAGEGMDLTTSNAARSSPKPEGLCGFWPDALLLVG